VEAFCPHTPHMEELFPHFYYPCADNIKRF